MWLLSVYIERSEWFCSELLIWSAELTERQDRLSALIDRFRLSARLLDEDTDAAERGNFHVYRTGEDALRLVFWPDHRRRGQGASRDGGKPEETLLVAAEIGISGAACHLVLALPPCVEVDLRTAPELDAVVQPLVREVLVPRCGGRAVFDRLMEVVVIRMLRHAMEQGPADIGLLAGLSEPRLARALVAVHEAPSANWTLETMAAAAGMSRTQFAVTFRKLVGVTPGDYVSNWRLEIGRAELEAGTPVKSAARVSGFSSSAAFSRAFSRRFGQSPREITRQVA